MIKSRVIIDDLNEKKFKIDVTMIEILLCYWNASLNSTGSIAGLEVESDTLEKDKLIR